MGRRLSLCAAALAAFTLQGCLARTAVDVVTLPVKVASRGVDLATTSQAEADQKRGREIRRREQRLGELTRQHEKLQRRCIRGDVAACSRDAQVQTEIQALMPMIPVEPD